MLVSECTYIKIKDFKTINFRCQPCAVCSKLGFCNGNLEYVYISFQSRKAYGV